jgi:hypothetical protein
MIVAITSEIPPETIVRWSELVLQISKNLIPSHLNPILAASKTSLIFYRVIFYSLITLLTDSYQSCYVITLDSYNIFGSTILG